MTNFIKLTQLNLTVNGEVKEKFIYVNPQHIKDFSDMYSVNYGMDLTAIHWALGGFNATNVKETPEEIIELINK